MCGSIVIGQASIVGFRIIYLSQKVKVCLVKDPSIKYASKESSSSQRAHVGLHRDTYLNDDHVGSFMMDEPLYIQA